MPDAHTPNFQFSDQKWRVKTKNGVSCNDAKRWISTN